MAGGMICATIVTLIVIRAIHAVVMEFGIMRERRQDRPA
jgi:Cu/Ag efflux pump CusA